MRTSQSVPPKGRVERDYDIIGGEPVCRSLVNYIHIYKISYYFFPLNDEEDIFQRISNKEQKDSVVQRSSVLRISLFLRST